MAACVWCVCICGACLLLGTICCQLSSQAGAAAAPMHGHVSILIILSTVAQPKVDKMGMSGSNGSLAGMMIGIGGNAEEVQLRSACCGFVTMQGCCAVGRSGETLCMWGFIGSIAGMGSRCSRCRFGFCPAGCGFLSVQDAAYHYY